MIFSTNIEPVCAYCEHGKAIAGTADIICAKKGLVRAGQSCKKFKYTPLRRIPPKKAAAPEIELPELND